MTKDSILIVEDDTNISDLLRLYLSSQGYEVRTAALGQEALDLCHEQLPDLVVLDVQLPDISGYDVGRALRSEPRTRDLPMIFLTAFNERRDRIIALGELRAQYFIAKPFDLEEVVTIIRNQIDESRQKLHTHPITGLPTGTIVNEQLRDLLNTDGWTLGLVRINGFETFTQFYGVLVGEEVLNFTALLIREVMQEFSSPGDFAGQMVVGPYFVIVSTPERLKMICERLILRFDQDIILHYAYKDRLLGHLTVRDPQGGGIRTVPLMSLSIGVLTSRDGPFHDIRHLSEVAEALCQRAALKGNDGLHKSAIAYGKS